MHIRKVNWLCLFQTREKQRLERLCKLSRVTELVTFRTRTETQTIWFQDSYFFTTFFILLTLVVFYTTMLKSILSHFFLKQWSVLHLTIVFFYCCCCFLFFFLQAWSSLELILSPVQIWTLGGRTLVILILFVFVLIAQYS